MMLSSRDDVWIGLNDINSEMRFLWTDGKGVKFTNWAKGYPVSVPDGRRVYGVDASVLSLLYTHTHFGLITHTCSLLLLLLLLLLTKSNALSYVTLPTC